MRFVSPRELARAAGVSESSVKRWCDQGLIPMQKTAGGHRRLPLDEAIEFLRQSHPDARFELLGLPLRSRQQPESSAVAADDFYRALVAGEEQTCRQIVFDLHLSGEKASRIFDTVVAPAFHCVGRGWECDEVQVYQERRGSGICMRILDELKAVIPQAKSTAPLAIGGTPDCDPYTLPTSMIEIVFRQAGWRSQSIGSGLPFSTLGAAITDMHPQLLWLSVSAVDDPDRFLAAYRDFRARVQADVAIIVGGRGLAEALRRAMEYTAFCDNLQHLEALAQTLKRGLPPAQEKATRTPAPPRKSRAQKK